MPGSKLLCSAVALAAGAATVLSFAPFGWYPLGILALALWYQCLTRNAPRGGFLLGWLYGLGLLGVGVFWIRISLNEFANLPPMVANGLMLLFIAAMALYYGLAGWVIGLLDARLAAAKRHWLSPILVLPSVWVLAEWLRSWILTGFPWLLLGNTQIDSPLAGWAPLLGVHGLSLVAALSAGLLWLAIANRCANRGFARLWAAAALAALWIGGGALRTIDWTEPTGEPFSVALIQANIAPSMKWQPEAIEPNLEAHLELTRQQLGRGLIVWPETAIPNFLHEVQVALIDPLAARARAEGSEIVIGVPIMDSDRRYYNGLISIGSFGDQYMKRHLVPFGEYLPLRDWVEPLVNWFEVPLADFSPGSADQPLLRVGNHWVGASICYEDVFPDEIRQALPEADYLINITNDAWFGDSLAPAQHLEFARLRALENGCYLIRATNTGISAIIDQKGRVVERLPSFQRDVLVGTVQPYRGATPFSALGSGVPIGLAVLMLLSAVGVSRRGMRR